MVNMFNITYNSGSQTQDHDQKVSRMRFLLGRREILLMGEIF